MSWTETHRGSVQPWQCDVTEHFTVACYFERLEEARASLADALGLADLHARTDIPRRIEARFLRELRQGSAFQIESAPLSLDGGLRLGHRFVDSGNGEAVTWINEHIDAPLTDAQRAAIGAKLADWGGPASEPRAEPKTTQGAIPSARGRVRRDDLDAAGRLGLGAMVHRFSAANAQLGAAIGMDARFEHTDRRGFSTFELILRLTGALDLDAPFLVETCIALFGGTSMRMVHIMTDAHSGAEIARLSQYGVNLDLDARRPARWPDAIRARAEKLVVPLEG